MPFWKPCFDLKKNKSDLAQQKETRVKFDRGVISRRLPQLRKWLFLSLTVS